MPEEGNHQLSAPVAHQAERGITLFGTSEPAGIVVMAGKMAKALSDVITTQKLYSDIKGRKHVKVEGWTLCGSMLGVFPVCVWTHRIEGGWEARVEARLRDGSVVGAAEAQCDKSEGTWSNRDDYALRSMAQTRATSKALRLPLGFIVAMSGYDTTPAEEMAMEREAARAAAAPPDAPSPAPAVSRPSLNPHTPAPARTGVPVISEKQAKRFYAMWKGAGKSPEQVQEYLRKSFNIDRDSDMPRNGYDVACAWAEDKGTQVIDDMERANAELNEQEPPF